MYTKDDLDKMAWSPKAQGTSRTTSNTKISRQLNSTNYSNHNTNKFNSHQSGSGSKEAIRRRKQMLSGQHGYDINNLEV